MKEHIAKWAAATMAVIACLAVFVWLKPLGQSRSLQFAVQTDVSLTVWLYSKPVARLLADYQARHPEINIDMRVFRSEEQLEDELAAALSTHVPPDMAELGSGFDLGALTGSGQLIPFEDEASGGDVPLLDPGYADAFRYGGKRWAMPYGAAVSVLYYNENLLRLPEAASAAAALSWDELTRQASKITQDVDGDGVTDIWGLVADPGALGSAMAASTAGTAERDAARLLGVWHDLVYQYKAMPALEHHLASSSFIDGAAGMLLAPSDIRLMLEEYIGGTFGFGLLPIPNESGGATAAWASGFAILNAGPEIQRIARQVISYLLEPGTQRRMFAETSKLPVLYGLAGELLETSGAGDRTNRERQLLAMAAGEVRLGSVAMNKRARERAAAIQEQLEGHEDACIPCLATAYQETMRVDKGESNQ